MPNNLPHTEERLNAQNRHLRKKMDTKSSTKPIQQLKSCAASFQQQDNEHSKNSLKGIQPRLLTTFQHN